MQRVVELDHFLDLIGSRGKLVHFLIEDHIRLQFRRLLRDPREI